MFNKITVRAMKVTDFGCSCNSCGATSVGERATIEQEQLTIIYVGESGTRLCPKCRAALIAKLAQQIANEAAVAQHA